MRARTAKEQAVEDLTRKTFWRRDERQIQETARPKYFLRTPLNWTRRGVWCTNCGTIIEYNPDLLVNLLEEGRSATITCPHCLEEIRRCYVEQGVGHKVHRDYDYVMKAEVVGDWQVLRYYMVYYDCAVGRPAEMGAPFEVVRRWYNVKHGGKPVVWSRTSGGFGGGFSLSSKLDLRREDRKNYYGYSCSNYRVRLNDGAIVAGSQWHPLLRRDGLNGAGTLRLLDVQAYDAPLVFTCPQLITLYKSHHFALVKYYSSDIHSPDPRIKEDWPSLKVALRHGYTIKDPGLWSDLIHSLRELGEDILSPRWICPKNLRAEHDLALRRLAKVRKLREEEKRRLEAAHDEKDYAKRIKPFLGFRLASSGIVITVIPSVAAVADEGKAMHHCVFENRYYKNADSLLLSARLETGGRLETIEYSLSRGQVLQSRGLQNSTTSKHNLILDMMAGASETIRDLWSHKSAR